jgi:hypothetical protein
VTAGRLLTALGVSVDRRKLCGDEVFRKAAGVAHFMLLGIDRESETGDETEADEGDDDVEQVRAFLFTFHRMLHVKELT